MGEKPEVRARIEERIRNVPEANLERGFFYAAKTVARDRAVHGNGVRPW